MAPHQQGGMSSPWHLDLGATLGAIEQGKLSQIFPYATPNKRDVIFDPALRRQMLIPTELLPAYQHSSSLGSTSAAVPSQSSVNELRLAGSSGPT
jgi:hypothetical protein